MKLRGRLGRETTYVVADGAREKLQRAAGSRKPVPMERAAGSRKPVPMERTADGGWFSPDDPYITYYIEPVPNYGTWTDRRGR
ncbi:hypothetical protein [Frankia sp. CeD]|uniref:hypothetical protein n=1 Tax=Frankia sp. CeD TaxID=258230 RepID=UPI0004DCF035|nr:hypothetical protein [Frankia sp. CeD]KEZ34757.1 hypothetical protein CEDDRAFT_03860 [Frankia sp. CeD]